MGEGNEAVAGRMTDYLTHRGPDDHLIWTDYKEKIVLGHTRLAIIDLSPGGRQPMSYDGGRLCIVFNGEIYNYREIQAELTSKGYTFQSHSDTEVLLAAYDFWGTDFLERLRGMFAFAIFNKRPDALHPRLFLARDRFGQKPLYYSKQAGSFLFSSEIGSLLNSGMVERKISTQALWDFLSLGSVPVPLTMVSQIFSLLPGHAMSVDVDLNIKIWRYWDLAEAAGKNFADTHRLSFNQAAEQLRTLLEEAARLHLVADVPVGAFLSGGIDSSIVVGLMSQIVHTPIQTCTIGFENQFNGIDETAWARKLADHFGTQHVAYVLTGEEVAANYDHLVRSVDQPSFDGTNTFFVSRLARMAGKVSLSGLGGDELFAGYVHFNWLMKADRRSDGVPLSVRRWITRVSSHLPDQIERRIPLSLLDRVGRHAHIRRFASDREKHGIANRSWTVGKSLRGIHDYYRGLVREELDAVACASYVETCGYMRNTLLRDTDAMSMAHALEVRPVLLDHVLAEFAFALPAEYKCTGDRSKYVLVEAARDLIPADILARPKMGFGMPLFQWLCGPLSRRVSEAFRAPLARKIFSAEYCQHAIQVVEAGGPEELRLWAYFMLLEWLAYEQMEL